MQPSDAHMEDPAFDETNKQFQLILPSKYSNLMKSSLLCHQSVARKQYGMQSYQARLSRYYFANVLSIKILGS
jgi:hypothetical protein